VGLGTEAARTREAFVGTYSSGDEESGRTSSAPKAPRSSASPSAGARVRRCGGGREPCRVGPGRPALVARGPSPDRLRQDGAVEGREVFVSSPAASEGLPDLRISRERQECLPGGRPVARRRILRDRLLEDLAGDRAKGPPAHRSSSRPSAGGCPAGTRRSGPGRPPAPPGRSKGTGSRTVSGPMHRLEPEGASRMARTSSKNSRGLPPARRPGRSSNGSNGHRSRIGGRRPRSPRRRTPPLRPAIPWRHSVARSMSSVRIERLP